MPRVRKMTRRRRPAAPRPRRRYGTLSARGGRLSMGAIRLTRTVNGALCFGGVNAQGSTNGVISTCYAPYTSGGTTFNFASYSLGFQLSNLPGYTDFTQLFDEFKVVKLEYIFMPRYSSAEYGAGTTLSGISIEQCGDVVTAIDQDGAYGNGSMNGILQYGNAKFHAPGKMFSVSFMPAAFTSLQTNPTLGTTSNVGKLMNKWVALSSGTSGGSVDYYGLNFCINATAANNVAAVAYDVYTRATLDFRKTL